MRWQPEHDWQLERRLYERYRPRLLIETRLHRLAHLVLFQSSRRQHSESRPECGGGFPGEFLPFACATVPCSNDSKWSVLSGAASHNCILKEICHSHRVRDIFTEETL